MENMPRPNELYRSIAKDYNPKQAEMNICKYVQGLEIRIAELERMIADKEKQSETTEEEVKQEKPVKKKGSKTNG